MLSRLSFLVALYVLLDVATPMLPGALVFSAEDSVETHQAPRFRAHDDASPSAPASDRVRPIEPLAPILVSRRAAFSAPRVRRAHIARPRLPSRTSASSAAEDH
jgi:hypothetical protein